MDIHSVGFETYHEMGSTVLFVILLKCNISKYFLQSF